MVPPGGPLRGAVGAGVERPRRQLHRQERRQYQQLGPDGAALLAGDVDSGTLVLRTLGGN